MPEPAEDAIVRKLIETLERLQEDLDQMELWTLALGYFNRPVPDYQAGDQYLLPHHGSHGAGRGSRDVGH